MRTRSVATADERILDVAEAATRAGARLVSFSGPGYGSTASGPGLAAGGGDALTVRDEVFGWLRT